MTSSANRIVDNMTALTVRVDGQAAVFDAPSALTDGVNLLAMQRESNVARLRYNFGNFSCQTFFPALTLVSTFLWPGTDNLPSVPATATFRVTVTAPQTGTVQLFDPGTSTVLGSATGIAPAATPTPVTVALTDLPASESTLEVRMARTSPASFGFVILCWYLEFDF